MPDQTNPFVEFVADVNDARAQLARIEARGNELAAGGGVGYHNPEILDAVEVARRTARRARLILDENAVRVHLSRLETAAAAAEEAHGES
jgi:multidrug efflux pump subunit AcrA (membrane-fusion protein)